MSNGGNEELTKAACDEAMTAIHAVLNDVDATMEQQQKAQAALDKLTVVRIEYFEKRIGQRTQLLQELSRQLEGVIAAIRTNPVGDLLDKAKGALSTVNDAAAAANVPGSNA